ncbi:MAG TPA: anaerobic ribonucleoside-triphosphate reductase, partial [Bacilli bacterium]|nr:anaerobic ribonucleoside-triphosphate reductase [Bacilli bacterium]
MMSKIRKRDGREVAFDIGKIENALLKALKASGEGEFVNAKHLAKKVTANLQKAPHNTIPTVEEIQDIVERVLIEEGYVKSAKQYILYRAERTRIREMKTRLMKTYEELTFKDAKDNDLKRENANIDCDTPMGIMLKYGSEGAKQFNEIFVLKPEHAAAHRKGDIHIHDFDFYTLTTTCCQIDIIKLFKNGFSTGHGNIREPNDIQTYSALTCIAIQANQNDQHGGQSIPNFDYGLALGVAKTYQKTYKQNLIKALELLVGMKDVVTVVNKISKKIRDENHLYPTLSANEEYLKLEKSLLQEDVSDSEIIDKAQLFACQKALEETDSKTYQAMEALIHNLNTMHSRAGAQVPFSSINYG